MNVTTSSLNQQTQMIRTVSSTPVPIANGSSNNSHPIHHFQTPDQHQQQQQTASTTTTNMKPNAVESIVNQNREIVTDKASLIASLNNNINGHSNGHSNGHTNGHANGHATNGMNGGNNFYQNVQLFKQQQQQQQNEAVSKVKPPLNTNSNHANGVIPSNNNKPQVPPPVHQQNGSHALSSKTRSLDGYVGFANLPNQVYRKSVKKGFEFNLMVIGESGLGKSTFINSLFLTELYNPSEFPGTFERKKKTSFVDASTVCLCEKGVNLKLTIVDTPGFGDSIDNTNCWQAIIDQIDNKFEEFLNAESKVNRKLPIADQRIHCCLYFIAPGHT